MSGLDDGVIPVFQRCPASKSIMRGHDRYWFGVLIDPGTCPKCGVRLKD